VYEPKPALSQFYMVLRKHFAEKVPLRLYEGSLENNKNINIGGTLEM
jgi:hypothetical protein